MSDLDLGSIANSVGLEPDNSDPFGFRPVPGQPVVFSSRCYVCRDPSFAEMCRKCPVYGGHIACVLWACGSTESNGHCNRWRY
jgi:hypothetical protein